MASNQRSREFNHLAQSQREYPFSVPSVDSAPPRFCWAECRRRANRAIPAPAIFTTRRAPRESVPLTRRAKRRETNTHLGHS